MFDLGFYQQRYAGKKLAILGFGREGQSTYRFLRRVLGSSEEITLLDENLSNLKNWLAQNHDEKVNLVQFRPEMASQLNQFDLIFRTPGISRTKLLEVEFERITSQTNEFLLTQADRTIAVTGTKGKSTTSSLIQAVLERLGTPTKLVGNIGQPALDLLSEAESDYFVYEMSSYQAENLSLAPAVGVVINLFEEHLDHYLDFADYVDSKMRLVSLPGQKLAVYGCDNPLLKSKRSEIQATAVRGFGLLANRIAGEAGIYLDGDQIVKIAENSTETVLLSADFERQLRGQHNLINALAALTVADYLVGLTEKNLSLAQQAIAEFGGLEHRLELVGNFRGIDFYNDSISTIPEAMERAIEAIDKVQTVIVGGQDRGVDRRQMIDYLNGRPDLKLICLPETGHQIFEQLGNEKYRVDDLEQAVMLAYRVTKVGRACLLSPASPSYGFFKNFEERGREFKRLVAEKA